MDKNYNVDDILEEIKRKKSRGEGASTATLPVQEEVRPRRTARPAAEEYEEEVRPRRTARPAAEEYEEEVRPRRTARPVAEEYEEEVRPRRTARPAAEEYEEEIRPRRTARPAAEEYEEEIRPRRTARPAAEEYEEEIRPRRTARPAAEEYEEKISRTRTLPNLTTREDMPRASGRTFSFEGQPDDEAAPFEETFRRAKEGRHLPQPDRQATRLRNTRLIADDTAEQVDLSGMTRSITRAGILLPEEGEEELESDFIPEKGPRFSFGKERQEQKKQKNTRRGKGAQRPAPVSDFEEEAPPQIDDFNQPGDADTVQKDIHSIRRNLMLRLIVTLVGFGALLYFSFAFDNLKLPLPTFMLPEKNMRAYLGVNVGILLLLTLFCSTTVGGGLVSLFTGKADGDSPVALAVLASIGQGVALIASPDAVNGVGVHLYFAVTALGLALNTLGKLFMIGRIDQNFKMLNGSSYEKYVMLTVKNRDLAHELTLGQNLETPVVAYSARTSFPTNFLELSYTEDYGENISKITTPLFAVFSLLAAGVTYFLSRNLYLTLTVFTALMAVCAPFTTTIVGNLPLKRMAGKLARHGAMVAGYTALDHFDDTNGFVVDANELFPKGSVLLHGIKSFDQKRVDEVILDAASVICKSNGLLREVFMDIIGGQERILKPVDSLTYEDGMGLSAWVDGKRVLIGNREQMKHHSVDLPSLDFEKKYVRDGRDILYLCNSGTITAMFILSYNADSTIFDELGALANRGISLVVRTTDPNLTVGKLSQVFDYPEDMLHIIPAKLHETVDALIAPRERARAEMVCTGTLLSKIYALKSVLAVKGSIVLGTILQILGMVLGYGFIAYFAFTGGVATLTFETLLAYQLFWAVIVMILPNLRRY